MTQAGTEAERRAGRGTEMVDTMLDSMNVDMTMTMNSSTTRKHNTTQLWRTWDEKVRMCVYVGTPKACVIPVRTGVLDCTSVCLFPSLTELRTAHTSNTNAATRTAGDEGG